MYDFVFSYNSPYLYLTLGAYLSDVTNIIKQNEIFVNLYNHENNQCINLKRELNTSGAH